MNGRRCLAGVLAALVALLAAPAAKAQDSHYWFDQFGNRALLLSGAVVGDPADLSSVYYNPGGLSLVEQTELLLAGLVISLARTSFEDAVAEGEDLRQRQFDVAPSLIAGEIPLGESKHRFAYSVLKRYGAEFRATAQANLTGDEFEIPTLALLGNLHRSIVREGVRPRHPATARRCRQLRRRRATGVRRRFAGLFRLPHRLQRGEP